MQTARRTKNLIRRRQQAVIKLENEAIRMRLWSCSTEKTHDAINTMVVVKLLHALNN